MRLTLDEAMLLKDRFDAYVDNLVGEDVTVRRGEDEFHVEVLRKRARTTKPDPNSSWIDIRPFTGRTDI